MLSLGGRATSCIFIAAVVGDVRVGTDWQNYALDALSSHWVCGRFCFPAMMPIHHKRGMLFNELHRTRFSLFCCSPACLLACLPARLSASLPPCLQLNAIRSVNWTAFTCCSLTFVVSRRESILKCRECISDCCCPQNRLICYFLLRLLPLPLDIQHNISSSDRFD